MRTYQRPLPVNVRARHAMTICNAARSEAEHRSGVGFQCRLTPSLHLRRWRAWRTGQAAAQEGRQQTARGRPARTPETPPWRQPDGLRERQADARPAQFASRSSPGQGRASGVKCKALLDRCGKRCSDKGRLFRFLVREYARKRLTLCECKQLAAIDPILSDCPA
jgi:hypothetical protein